MDGADVTDGVVIPVSAGELIDRITILKIKSLRIQDVDKLRNVRLELDELQQIRDRELTSGDVLRELERQLSGVNELLWDIEDAIRRCERLQDFGETFVQLARSVYLRNDRRGVLKRRINELVGSRLVEEKEYDEYEEFDVVADSQLRSVTTRP